MSAKRAAHPAYTPLAAALLAVSVLWPLAAHAAPKEAPKEAPKTPPNVLIIILDDAGFAQADTFGGAIHTPTLSRIAQSGIAYNAFHTTAISSATRASLLTGRNHHRVGNGTVTEMAVEGLDGYTGVIPPGAGTIPQVLKQQGYATAAFGKWHNTPAVEASPRGPFKHWPMAYGFDHFYGFNGGETDQYQPRLFDDGKAVEPPRDGRYQLGGDLADKAIAWLDQQHAKAPGKPFFMYWGSGGVHAPHQVLPEWSDRYKGKFDSGWDAYRQAAFERQKAMGWIPKDTVNTPRPDDMPAWNSLSPEERKFQAREMEVYAGFLEYTDTQAGRVVDELERLGVRNNTLIFYVFSDNGASSEGMAGSINDLAGLNGITKTAQDSIQVLNEKYGGLSALGGPKLEEHYAAAWAWAGEAPLVGTKLVAGYFGGTRTPLAVSWPAGITPSKEVRQQFHHVNDVAATIYEVAGVKPPETLNGVRQEPLDGISMAYTFNDAKAVPRKRQQYFEIMGSRGEYADGWMASVFGPRKPWVADQSGLLSWAGKLSFLLRSPWIGNTLGWLKWKPEDDHWALFDLQHDYSQAKDVSAQFPEKLAALQRRFDEDAKANHVYPIGASFTRIFNPERQTQTEWHFGPDYNRQPELAAPNIKSRDNVVTVDADFPAHASGVLFSLGTTGGGLVLFVKDGVLTYEYNGFSFERTQVRARQALPAGRAQVAVELSMESVRRAGPATAVLRINGTEVGRGHIPLTAPVTFSATGTFDVGQNLGAPVSLDYADQAPFAFNGRIRDVQVQYR